MLSLSKKLNPQKAELYSKIELRFSAKGLKNMDLITLSDPVLHVFQRGSKAVALRKVGETEELRDTLNPEWERHVSLNFRFEELQLVTFRLFDVDKNGLESLGEVRDVPLSRLVGAEGHFEAPIDYKGRSGGTLFVTVVSDDSDEASERVRFASLRARKLKNMDHFFSKSDAFLKVYGRRGDRWVLARRTEVVPNNLNPIWRPFDLRLGALMDEGIGEASPVLIECWDEDETPRGRSEQYIGECELTLGQLIAGSEELPLPLMAVKDKRGKARKKEKKKIKQHGLLLLECFQYSRPSLLDYVRGGVSIDLVVAIDFTGSNGNPHGERSLHSIARNYKKNMYLPALEHIMQILLPYDADSTVKMLGFGARVGGGSGVTSHAFSIPLRGGGGGVHSVEGAVKAYKETIEGVVFSGPTYFSKIIEKSTPANPTSREFTMLLFLTDGVICDFEKTKSAIIQASTRPMAIIIVGVGNADFTEMETLDGDEEVLEDRYHRKAEADIVQFVAYKEVKNNPIALASEVLAELPDQLVDYYLRHGILPNGQKFDKMNTIKRKKRTAAPADHHATVDEDIDEDFHSTHFE